MKIFKIIFIILSILIFILFALPYIAIYDKKQAILNELELELPTSSNSEFALVYFGYVGCKTICSPILKEVSDVLSQVNQENNVQFYFINISDNADAMDEYLNFFDTSFIGLDIEKNKKRILMDKLNAYSSRSIFDKEEFIHSGNLYLFRKNGNTKYILQRIFDFRPYNSPRIVEKLKKEII